MVVIFVLSSVVVLVVKDSIRTDLKVVEATADPSGTLDMEEDRLIEALGQFEVGANIQLHVFVEETDSLIISAGIMAALRESQASMCIDFRCLCMDIPSFSLVDIDEGEVRLEAIISEDTSMIPEDLLGRPVYRLNMVSSSDPDVEIHMRCSVSVNYDIGPGEDTEGLYVVFVGEGIGEIGCKYEKGKVVFETERLSIFVLAWRQQGQVESEVTVPRELIPTSPSQWSYMGGDVESFGVTDSKAPIDVEDFVLKWSVTYPADGGSMVWRTPSSALCVDDRVYYYNGIDNAVYCLDIDSGTVLAKGKCESKAVYNMGLAYGDGKLFAATCTGPSTVLRAYDAETLDQLFTGTPVRGGEMQGTLTYRDGKVFFGTYSGDYACFSTEDRDRTRSDEVSEPVWVIESDGWYNATPAFSDDFIILVQRGFSTSGATAYLIERETGKVRDLMHFDREYSSSAATVYEGRVYIPLARVIDRTVTDPDEQTAQHLILRSFEVSPNGFSRNSEKVWESDASWGSTQSMAVIWNDTIYIGGGGKTMGTDEPLWILDIQDDGSMKVRGRMSDILTKSTPMITTAYSSEENGYAVYLYLMEYGHVYEGEAADSTKGYADVFVIRDSKNGNPQVVATFRPNPEQFCYQSFSISKDGYVLIRNDSTLFCYGTGNRYDASDVSRAIDRFLSMAEDGNVNKRDYERILDRYESLNEDEKGAVSNYQDLVDFACTVTLRTVSGDMTITVPRGAVLDIPDVPVPVGKTLKGWKENGVWVSYSLAVNRDTVLEPVYADAVRIVLDPVNGTSGRTIYLAKGDTLPFVPDPQKDGYEFDGWYLGNELYLPYDKTFQTDSYLKARWLKVSEISFDTDGGNPVSGAYYGIEGRPLSVLPSTSRTGHTFQGWYLGETLYTEGTLYTFDKGITLKARWTENPQNFVTNGRGITVSGNIPVDSSLETAVASILGSTSAELTSACKRDHGASADCIVITLKGAGIDPDLPLTVSVRLGSAYDGQEFDVYYMNDGVKKTKGSVHDGLLTFEARGNPLYGGVHLVFAIKEGTGIKGCV